MEVFLVARYSKFNVTILDSIRIVSRREDVFTYCKSWTPEGTFELDYYRCQR